jgi:hypothetical protein
MRHTRTIPLAALLLAAACAEAPTGLPAASRPSRSHEEVPRPSASFDRAATGCTWPASDQVECQFRLTDVQNVPAGARVLVSAYIVFAGDYVCVNARTGRPRPRSGGTYYEQKTQDFWFTDYAAPLTGQATLTPSLRSDMCGKNGGVPEIVTLRPVSAGVNASAVQVVNGGTSSRSLDDVFTEY